VRAQAGVAAELARAARGGMRDALSQADKLLAFAGDEPTLADLERLGGEAGSQDLEALLSLTERGDRPALLSKLQALEGDEEAVLEGLLTFVRHAAVLAYCGEGTPLVPLTGAERSLAAERGRRLGAERLELWLHELLRARERLRLLAGQERTVLELCLLELSRAEATLPLGELVTRLEVLEGRLGAEPGTAPRPSGAAAVPGERVPRPTAAPASSAPLPGEPPRSTPAPLAAAAGNWERFLAELRVARGALAALLERRGPSCLVEGADDRTRFVLGHLTPEDERLLGDKHNQRACEQAFAKVYGRTLVLELARASPVREPAERAPSKDALTQRMIQEFEGTVEELS
jgi:DNA polymerase III gamma/tau subunit